MGTRTAFVSSEPCVDSFRPSGPRYAPRAEEPRTMSQTLTIPPDRFDEWHALTPALECDDPRFVVAQARPEQFEAIYDCVDEAFGRPRLRAAFDWFYRDNPYGLARVWYVALRESGRIVKTGAFFPWPIWRGDRALELSTLSGDAGTVPDFQRQGLTVLRKRVRRSHPFHPKSVSIAGPNAGSRTVSKKTGEQSSVMGPLLGGVAILDGRGVEGRAGRLPKALARPAGAVAGWASNAWRRTTLRPDTGYRFEPVSRCPADFDAITLETMRFDDWWCPHSSRFLDWRYLDHPIERYAAFALVEEARDVAVGYSVLRLADGEATLSEFAARPEHAPSLLAHSLAVARQADCGLVNFFSGPNWRHWPLFRRAGFLSYRTDNYLDATDWTDRAASESFDAWQVMPGDRDFH